MLQKESDANGAASDYILSPSRLTANSTLNSLHPVFVSLRGLTVSTWPGPPLPSNSNIRRPRNQSRVLYRASEKAFSMFGHPPYE